MHCYEHTSRRTEALSVYRRMQQLLSLVLGIPPSQASRRQYRMLLELQAAEKDVANPGADMVELPSYPRKRTGRNR